MSTTNKQKCFTDADIVSQSSYVDVRDLSVKEPLGQVGMKSLRVEEGRVGLNQAGGAFPNDHGALWNLQITSDGAMDSVC